MEWYVYDFERRRVSSVERCTSLYLIIQNKQWLHVFDILFFFIFFCISKGRRFMNQFQAFLFSHVCWKKKKITQRINDNE